MNNHKNYILLLICILTCSIIASCWKQLEPANQISVSGVVRDVVKQKNLPGAKLYLFGAHRVPWGIHYSDGPLDSTIADHEGKFSIKYLPKESFWDLGLTIGQLRYGGYYYGNEMNYVIDVHEPVYKFNYQTKINDAIVKARELNYTKVHLKVISNPYDSFYVRPNTLGFRRPVLVIGQSIDTTVLIRHIPNEFNVFQFYTEALRDTIGLRALNSIPNSRTYSIRRMVADTFWVGLQDTFSISKTIINSLDMPRQ
jgi:hypothetical protein